MIPILPESAKVVLSKCVFQMFVMFSDCIENDKLRGIMERLQFMLHAIIFGAMNRFNGAFFLDARRVVYNVLNGDGGTLCKNSQQGRC